MALPGIFLLIRPPAPLRHRRSGVPPFGSIACATSLAAGPSMAAYDPKKSARCYPAILGSVLLGKKEVGWGMHFLFGEWWAS